MLKIIRALFLFLLLNQDFPSSASLFNIRKYVLFLIKIKRKTNWNDAFIFLPFAFGYT